MNINNIEIRKAIDKKRIKYFELAHALGINPCTLSRWLAAELSEDRKKAIEKAIRDFKY
ncbi:MAG: hypothetical protein K6G10_01035 [Butyrivibrio sp.]|nr:hypothetical protein [Butyrivibrio sp.]